MPHAAWITGPILSLCVAAVTAAAEPTRTPAEHAKVDSLVASPLSWPEPLSLVDLRKAGTVISETSRLLANRHDSKQQDEVRALGFDGLLVEVVFPNRDYDHGLIFHIVVTKPLWKMQHGIAVGTNVKELETVLGQPDERESGRMKYCGDRACGVFFVRDNRIVRVEFENPVD